MSTAGGSRGLATDLTQFVGPRAMRVVLSGSAPCRGVRGRGLPAKHPRRAARPTGAIKQTGECAPLLRARRSPPARPGAGGRRRDAMTSRHLPQRAALLDQHDQRITAGQSELRVTVQTHPSPPSGRGLSQDPQPRRRAGRLSAVQNVWRSVT